MYENIALHNDAGNQCAMINLLYNVLDKKPDNSSSTETDSDKDPESSCRNSKRQAANIEETTKLKRRANRKKMGKIPNQVTILIQRILQIQKK